MLAMNAAWGGIVGMNEIIVGLGSHKTAENTTENMLYVFAGKDALDVRLALHKLKKVDF